MSVAGFLGQASEYLNDAVKGVVAMNKLNSEQTQALAIGIIGITTISLVGYRLANVAHELIASLAKGLVVGTALFGSALLAYNCYDRVFLPKP